MNLPVTVRCNSLETVRNYGSERAWFGVLLFLFFALGAARAYSSPSSTVIDGTQDSVFIADHVSYFIDETGNYTIEDMQSAEADLLFKRHDRRLFSVGTTASTHWFKVELLYTGATASDWIIDLRSSSSFDDIVFYRVNPDGQYESIATGNSKPAASREVAVRSFAFPVRRGDRDSETFYFRIKPAAPLTFDAFLSTPERFYQAQIVFYAMLALFAGIALSIMAFHGYQYLISRQRSDAAFVLYITLLTLFMLNERGFSYHFPWLFPDIDIHFKRIYFGLTMGALHLAFTYFLLDINNGHPRLKSFYKRLFFSFALLFIMPAVLYPFLGIYNPVNRTLIPIFMLISFATIIGSTIYAVRNGYTPARLFLAAEIFAVVGQSSKIFALHGLVEGSIVVLALPLIGATGQLLLQSFSIASKYEKVRQENQRMQQQLLHTAEESDRVKTEFLSVINHELRTPLHGIVSSLAILSSAVPESAQQWINNLKRFSEQMSSMINKILDFTDLQSGNFKANKETFALEGLINELSDYCTPLCEDKQLAFESNAADSIKLQKLTGDRKSLARALIVVLDNAIKFTEKGSVTLGIHDEDNDHYRFVIVDTGIGISEEHQADIFNTFSQADASISRKQHGLGFSLALCRELVATMGGNLEVDSQPGKGSTFSFQIELNKSEAGAEQESSSTSLPSPAQPELPPNHRILVVEDDEMNQIIMETVLDQLGYDYVLAENGLVALNILETDTAFDVVLMDCQMPEMDGFTATKHIRSSSGTIRDIPILAVTANLSSGDVNNCFECGMNEVIEKPVSPELLGQKILAYV